MTSYRSILLLVAVCAYAVQGVSGGSLFVCQHETGEVQIEWTGALCCADTEAAAEPSCDVADHDSITKGCDCTDSLLKTDTHVPAHRTTTHVPLKTLESTVVESFLRLGSREIVIAFVLPEYCGPPYQEAHLTHHASVVLHC